jgi:hypothetical protein
MIISWLADRNRHKRKEIWEKTLHINLFPRELYVYYMCDTYHVNKGTALFDISITKQEFEDEARIYIYIYIRRIYRPSSLV